MKGKRQALSSSYLSPRSRNWQAALRSPQSHLLHRLNTSHSLSLSSQASAPAPSHPSSSAELAAIACLSCIGSSKVVTVRRTQNSTTLYHFLAYLWIVLLTSLLMQDINFPFMFFLSFLCFNGCLGSIFNACVLMNKLTNGRTFRIWDTVHSFPIYSSCTKRTGHEIYYYSILGLEMPMFCNNVHDNK